MNTHAARIAAQLDAWYLRRIQETYYKHKHGRRYALYLEHMQIRGNTDPTAYFFTARTNVEPGYATYKLEPVAAQDCTFGEYRAAIADEVERVVAELLTETALAA